jgi:hypothetical protein
MSPHQSESDPPQPDPPRQVRDAEPLPAPAEEFEGYLYSYPCLFGGGLPLR